MTSASIQIRLATDDDYPTIESSFTSHFLQDEPLNIYLKDYKSSDHEIVPNFGLTLVAEIVDPTVNDVKFAGFLVCEICKEARKKDQEIPFSDNRAKYEVSRILREIDAKFDVFTLYNVKEVLDLVVLSVVPEYRGKSIGLKLCEKAIDIGKAKGCGLVYVDCTSLYSSAIADKLGMQCIGEISYEQFQVESGEILYSVNGRHTHLRRYVKVFKE